jgi:hypothetical protein
MTNPNTAPVALSDDEVHDLVSEACNGMVTRVGADREYVLSLREIRAILAAQERGAAVVPEGCVAIRAEIVRFLTGECPLDGVWFGEKHPTERGTYWWRKRLPDAPLGAEVKS